MIESKETLMFLEFDIAFVLQKNDKYECEYQSKYKYYGK